MIGIRRPGKRRADIVRAQVAELAHDAVAVLDMATADDADDKRHDADHLVELSKRFAAEKLEARLKTALLGEKAAMACTVAVEETIDRHYADQLEQLGDDEAELRETIFRFRTDEIEHRDIALERGAEGAPGYPVLSAAIKTGFVDGQAAATVTVAGLRVIDLGSAQVLATSTDAFEGRGVESNVAVTNASVKAAIDAIQRAALTGKIGDGKIFVLPVDTAIRIRTQEEGESAI